MVSVKVEFHEVFSNLLTNNWYKLIFCCNGFCWIPKDSPAAPQLPADWPKQLVENYEAITTDRVHIHIFRLQPGEDLLDQSAPPIVILGLSYRYLHGRHPVGLAAGSQADCSGYPLDTIYCFQNHKMRFFVESGR